MKVLKACEIVMQIIPFILITLIISEGQPTKNFIRFHSRRSCITDIRNTRNNPLTFQISGDY